MHLGRALNSSFRCFTSLIFFCVQLIKQMEQELPKQMISKVQENESKKQKQERQICQPYQRPSEKLQNAIKDKFPSYAKKYLNLDVKINSDIKLTLRLQRKSKQQGSANIHKEDEEITDSEVGWKQYNAIFNAFLKYTNTNFDPQENQAEAVSNIITRISSELRYNQRRNFKRSFYYLTITTEKDRTTYVMRNCFGEITRMTVQQDSSKGLPRFITQNIKQLDNLVIIIHELKGFESQGFSSKNEYFIEKLNKCIYFKKQNDTFVLQNMFFQKSAKLQAKKYKRDKRKNKIIKKGRNKQQKIIKKLDQKQNQSQIIEQSSISDQKQQKEQLEQFQELPQPNQIQISQFEQFYKFLIKQQSVFLSQRDSRLIKQAIAYFDLHLLNISKSKDLKLDYKKSILFLKQMISKNCIFETQNQLNKCRLRNGHFPDLQAESNKCVQCGARTKFQCKLCSFQQNRPVPLCVPDKHQRDCLKKYHIKNNLSLKFKFQEQKSDQQEKISQPPIKKQMPKQLDNLGQQNKESKHTVQQYKLIKRLDVLNQRIDAKVNQLFRQKRFNDLQTFINCYRSTLILKQLQIQRSRTLSNSQPDLLWNGLKMEEQ